MTARLAFFLAGVSCGLLGASAAVWRTLLRDLPYEFGGKA